MTGRLTSASDIAVSGMKAQSERLRVISENMANADSVSVDGKGEPYRRQVVTFKEHIDAQTGARGVAVDKVIKDKAEFVKKYDPNHPMADNQGYINTPNVNPLIEMMDMKEAQRSYEANLAMMKAAKDMNAKTLDLLK